MSEKHELCKHDGGHYIKNGRAFNRLYFCLQCGQPIIIDILDLIAFLRSPRFLQNGRVKKKKLLLNAKIDVIIENARLINYGAKRQKGRPRNLTDEELDDPEKLCPWDMTEKGHGGFNHKIIDDYDKSKDYFGTSEPKGYAYSSGLVKNLQWRRGCWTFCIDMLEDINPVLKKNNITEMFEKILEVIKVFSKVHIRLKKRDLRFILAALLVDSGNFTSAQAMTICSVGSHHTLKNWQEKIGVLQSKMRIYPKMAELPLYSELLEPDRQHRVEGEMVFAE